MQKSKIKTYVLKYEKTELRQGRGENVGKKIRVTKDYWMVKYKYVDRAGKNRESTKRGFKTKQEAEAYVESIKGNFISPNKLSMNQLFDIWFEDYQSEDDLAQNTVNWHYYNLLHLRAGLGNMLVQEVDLLSINNFLTSLKNAKSGKELSATSKGNIRRTLNQALDFGVEQQYISVNPLKLKKKRRSTKKTIALQNQFKAVTISQKKIIKLIESASDHNMALVIALAGLLGLRRGEIRGLLWENIDLDKRLIYIRKQLCGNSTERGILKTIASERTLQLPVYVMFLLQRVTDLQSSAKLVYGEDKFESSYVLADTSDVRYIGTPYSANYYSANFLAALKQAGMPRMRLHDLRHSFGSNLLYQGIPIPTISKLMGHASVATTLNDYAHEIEELKAIDEEKINLNIEATLSCVRNGFTEPEIH